MSATGSDRARDEWRALWRRPGYAGFVATVLVSRIVGVLFITAGVLLVLQRTHDPALAGTVSAAEVVPAVVAGPLLGAWLDVAARRRVLIVADQMLSVVALVALLLLAGHAPNWTLPLCGVVYGATRPFSTGSFSSTLSALAGEDLLDRASAIEATSINATFIVGPALAGVLSSLFGPARVIGLQAVLTALTAIAIALNPSFEARTGEPAPGMHAVLATGLRTLARHRALRANTIGSGLGNFGWSLMMVTFPLWAVDRLHSHQSSGGFLWAAVAIGSIAGTFLLPAGPSALRITRSYVTYGLSVLLWLLARSLPVGFGLVLLTGLLEGPAFSGAIAVRQRETPPEARTQVLNTAGSIGMAGAALGSALGGTLASPPAAFVAFAAVNLLAAAVVASAGRSAARAAA